MQPTIFLPFAALFCGFAILLTWAVQVPVRQRRMRRIEAERLDAYRRLYTGMEAPRQQAHFSYRPATRQLVIDVQTARMHGLDPADAGSAGSITLEGWHQLPAAAAAAGWIDEALADGLRQEQPVCCEYLARVAGRPDLHVVLNAVPAPRAGLLVGLLVERVKTSNSLEKA